MHHPKYVDTANALALLQEEEIEASKKKFTSRDSSKPAFRTVSHAEKPKATEPDRSKTKPVDDKWGTLKAYRRQNGHCFKRGKKWGPGYKCPTQVSIHVVEELLDALEDGEV